MNKILTAEQLTMIRADVEAYLQNNRKLQPGPRDTETILQLLDTFDAERATVKILAEATTALLSRAEKAETELAAVLGVIDKVAFAGEVAEAEASFHKIENSVRTEYHTSEAPPIPHVGEVFRYNQPLPDSPPQAQIPEPYVDQTNNVVVDPALAVSANPADASFVDAVPAGEHDPMLSFPVQDNGLDRNDYDGQ